MTSPAPRVALVAAQWHADIVERAVDSFGSRLVEHGFAAPEVFRVPGAFEVPLLVTRLARPGRYAAVATVALVADGGIYRHEFVAQAVVDCPDAGPAAEDAPVFSGVLTPHHFHEHEVHREQLSRHFVVKGAELVDAVAGTVPVLDEVAAAQ